MNFSETFIKFYKTTRRHIPEDGANIFLQNADERHIPENTTHV
jgi:hypothetical protein